MAWKLPRLFVIAAIITTAIWLSFFSRYRLSRAIPEPEPSGPPPPRYETWGIRDLNEVVEISSIRAKATFEHNALPIKEETDLEMSFTSVNLTQPMPYLQTTLTTIHAPIQTRPDASSLLIGMATQLDRLRDSLPSIEIWASGTGVKFVVIVGLAEEGGTTVQDIEQLYASRDIQMKLIESNATWYEQYASLPFLLYDHADHLTKWISIIDDDTFFFSMNRLLNTLARYNHDEKYYIGGLSENKWSMDHFGIFAFGGAGIFMSLPLLEELRPYEKECSAMTDDAGDWRICSCITSYTTTKFTWEHNLFQMDLHGDVSGFYEVARNLPISTHHWKSWHHQDMAQVGAVARACGNECILQKYMTSNGWKLTNGYSFVKYSWNETEERKYIEGAMEHTWAETIWVIPTSWKFTLAPIRPKDEGKIQYKIEKVEEDENTLTIYYVRRVDDVGYGIIRMTWEKSPQY